MDYLPRTKPKSFSEFNFSSHKIKKLLGMKKKAQKPASQTASQPAASQAASQQPASQPAASQQQPASSSQPAAFRQLQQDAKQCERGEFGEVT